VKPFWRAMLGYVDVPGLESEIRDRADRTTTVWFQDSDSEAEGRQRWHLDVSVPAEQAEARVQAAIDAGGRLVSDERAPAFWVLADPEGNLGCICTWQARD
jgi:4a-hydroxytetrahydrobiopterin dehydratase